MSFPPLIGTAALQARLGNPALIVLDASWYLPDTGRDARVEFSEGHIPGAQFFDLDLASDHATTLPHMLPVAAEFESVARGLGISADAEIVVYDGSGVNLSAARVWWMFRAFGHERVSVLDGGLGAWRAERRPLEPGEPTPRVPGTFHAVLRASSVRTLDEMVTIVGSGSAQVVDARPAGRFRGRDPEPRPGLRSGRMPGALSIPYAELVDETGRMLGAVSLRERFSDAGVDLAAPVVATCGSGTSACAVLLALEVLGAPAGALYDGSWTEWAGRDDTSVEVG